MFESLHVQAIRILTMTNAFDKVPQKMFSTRLDINGNVIMLETWLKVRPTLFSKWTLKFNKNANGKILATQTLVSL